VCGRAGRVMLSSAMVIVPWVLTESSVSIGAFPLVIRMHIGVEGADCIGMRILAAFAPESELPFGSHYFIFIGGVEFCDVK